MRKKRVELVDAVVRSARGWRNTLYDSTGIGYEAFRRFQKELIEALDALDALELDELTSPAPYARGSQTSRTAAELVAPRRGTYMEQILAYLASVPPMAKPGYTDEQLEQRLNKPHQTVSSARNSLMEGGWVQDSGEKRRTRSKRPAVVWELTPAARTKLKGEG